jgi:hypothetical protein
MTNLYCILARAAETGIIFRRGPSKQVRLIGWNLRTHTFEPGQWLKGRIYERKSDLSPNGTKLVYFGAKYTGELPTWIAVSTPPFLKAHVLWRAVGTWSDLSLFETDSTLALATYLSDSSLEPAIGFKLPPQLQVKHKPWPSHFHKLADHSRLIRDGWSVYEGDPLYRPDAQAQVITYRRPILEKSRSVYLEMSAANDGKVSYALNDGHGQVVGLKADWAEVRSENVLFSLGGKMFRMAVTKSNKKVKFGPATELADFADMKFEAIEAPPWATNW